MEIYYTGNSTCNKCKTECKTDLVTSRKLNGVFHLRCFYSQNGDLECEGEGGDGKYHIKHKNGLGFLEWN